MPLPTEIQDALLVYDQNKNVWRHLLGDHAAIHALRKLSDVDHTHFPKIYRCFIEHLPKPTQESYRVFQAVLNYLGQIGFQDLPEVMNALHCAKLLKNNHNLDRLNNLQSQFGILALLFNRLSDRQLLTQKSFDLITQYDEEPEKVSMIGSAINALLEADCLAEENFSALSKLLLALHKNQLLTQENTDEVILLPLNSLRLLTYLLKKLNTYQLLTQENFDRLTPSLKIPEIIDIITRAADTLDDANHLTQENFNSLLDVPNQAANTAVALLVLSSANLLTLANREKLHHTDNRFLLSNEATSLVWRPLLTYLLGLSTAAERQSIYDQLVKLAQQENPAEKIQLTMKGLLTSQALTHYSARRVGIQNQFFSDPSLDPAESDNSSSTMHPNLT